jgi:tetratricopeptide (TPR) repeat protein
VLHREEYPTVDNARGLFHVFHRDLEAARAHFVRALLASEGRYYELYVNLGAVLLHLGDLETARRCYLVVLQDDPENPLAHQNLATIARRLAQPSALDR